jgi:hypothetical protein
MAEVLPVQIPEGQNYFSASPLRRSSPSPTSIFVGPPSYTSRRSPYPSTPDNHLVDSLPSSTLTSSRNSQIDILQSSSTASTTSRSTLTLDTTFDADDGLNLPSYGGVQFHDDDDGQHSPMSTPASGLQSEVEHSHNGTAVNSPDKTLISEDDSSLKTEPSRHVDYLSHEWVEEDIWSSWRHIVSKRKVYGERSRLENASWRTWAKQKYSLRTVSPETLNW